MNKKAFTLVELLAVIIILGLLATLTSVSVTKLLKDAKNELSDIQIESIKTAAESFYADNLDALPKDGECNYITLKDLKEYGLLDPNVINVKDSSKMSDDLKVKVTSTLSSYGKLINEYEVEPENITGCIPLFGHIATLLDDADNDGEISIGDKYSVKVDPNRAPYTFYVLSEDGDNVNLIMDRNICSDGTEATSYNTCLVAWVSKGDYADDTSYGSNGNNNKGPITATKYLNQATSSWREELILNTVFNDNDGGDASRYSNFVFNGHARLPYYSELLEIGCTTTVGSCPAWAVNGLNYASSYPVGTKEDITGVYGYWTASSINSSNAWDVGFGGDLYNQDLINSVTDRGIRPVITLSYFDIR